MTRFFRLLASGIAAFVLAAFPFVTGPAIAGEELSVADTGRELAEKYRGRAPVQWGEHFPGIIDSLPPSGDAQNPASRTLALTFDACEGGTDTRIIALLREHKIPATIFATNIWLRRNQTVAHDLAADPLFTLACHGKRHKPASVNGRTAYGIAGTKSIPALVEEVEDNARAIAAVTGKRPRWYRSGTAHYDDVAVAVIFDLGLAVAGYALSADQGASLPAREVARNLLRAPDRAIVLMHLNHPESGTYQGLATALPTLLEKGVRFVGLE
ncbi:Polysaccharide deacetylase [uncultured delta proteobacterium]|uniref:Polysaccharide deacetylase n=1 Tax=uncultured delta proteobacterium TaxID=34034 RepID=A0A212JPK1_9DELT|nr:Polysaccharide deacetylase [uncultured delta proteobacterium]